MRTASRQPKVVLYWNNFFDVGHFYSSKLSPDRLVQAKCPVTDCIFIDNVDLFNQSDVVIFFAQYLYEIPTYRFPHQHFVFFQMESPANNKSPTLMSNKTRYNFFNRTMTYRLDSDIVSVELHGKIARKRPNAEIVVPPWTTIARAKTKLVAWFVTNCETRIKREDYVKELARYIPVDIYGHCGNLPQFCGGSSRDDCNAVLRDDYKFYLAFENSWCPDYVTEKFYRALHFDSVPIVMGGANYDQFAPPHSYINVADYASPMQLAEYLLLLNRTDDLYEEYFDWKYDYKVEFDPMDGWCDLCRMAHDQNVKPKVYEDIRQWWEGDGQCEKSYSSFISQ